jgi:hypothetical protein
MKEILSQLVDRLEKHDLMQINLNARLTALEISHDSLPDASEDHSKLQHEFEQNADGTRQAILTLYGELQQLIAKLPD